jgi:hypothetical protein
MPFFDILVNKQYMAHFWMRLYVSTIHFTLYYIMTSKQRIVTTLIFLSIALIIIWSRKNEEKSIDGFSQETEFLLKEGDDVMKRIFQIKNTHKILNVKAFPKSLNRLK